MAVGNAVLRQEKNQRGECVPEKVLIQSNSKEKKQHHQAALQWCALHSQEIGLGMMLCP